MTAGSNSPSPRAARGAFICFEGLDRCGKTTQSSRLAEDLRARGLQVQQTRYPDRTTSIGEIINRYLQSGQELSDECIHLLFSANRWEAQKPLQTTLESGTHVVCDRYAYSGVAYSVAKGMDLEWCRGPDVGLLRPDLVVFLDAAPEKVAARAEYGEERYEKVDFQNKVYAAYKELADDAWLMVDALQPMDDIAAQIRARVDLVLEKAEYADFEHLA
jgi:dTMP kinase